MTYQTQQTTQHSQHYRSAHTARRNHRAPTNMRTTVPPSRVLLIGCGVVGTSVFKKLARPELPFEVVCIGVKDLQKRRDCEISPELLTDDIEALLTRPHDVIVEVTSDPELAKHIAFEAQHRGVTVITASKVLAADHGHELSNLRFSASVGGGAPVLETIDKALLEGREIESIEGILNGTCNFILDQVRKGDDFVDAVQAAIESGFAEADPTRDVDGTDTADKVRIIARRAFGFSIQDIAQAGIQEVVDDGKTHRLIGKVDRFGNASVKPTVVAPDHPFFDVSGEHNAVVIRFVDGDSWTVRGKGAGGEPTASAVISDLLEARASGELKSKPKRTIHYEIEGPEGAPLVLCLGGISAGSRASQWWEGVVGDGCSLDTREYRVLSVDWCAGDVEQSDFGVDEQATALLEVLKREDFATHAIIGASFGGLVAQRLVELDPTLSKNVIVLAAAHRPHPFASGLRHIQRSILKRGAQEDVALARSLAMLTYRSALEFSDRFLTPEEVAAYLDYNGEQIVGRFSAQAYTGLSSAIDAFTSEPQKCKQNLTLIGFDTDILVPPQILEELCEQWGGPSTLEVIPTRFGHDGFLKETTRVGLALVKALGETNE